MKKYGILLVGLLCAVAGMSQKNADSVFRNYLYDTRTMYFNQLPAKKGAFVFWGDSITQWGDWSEFTGNAFALNRGIAGDNTYGLLNRVDEVLRHAPSKIFIMIGTNDINIHIPLSVSINNYEKIITYIKKQSPNTIIFIQSVLPVNNQLINRNYYIGANESIQAMNQCLDSLASKHHVVYVNLYKHFLDSAAQMDAAYTYDGLHLNGTGYMKWVSILKKSKYL